MTDHFTLDVHPEALRQVATRIDELREHLRGLARTTGNQPGQIADQWTGGAATEIKQAMSDLGGLIGTFDAHLEPVANRARGLAGTYQEALDRLPDLNRRWEAANSAYTDAVRAADRNVETQRSDLREDGGRVTPIMQQELNNAHTIAVSGAGDDRRSAQHNLEIDVGYMKQWLRQETGKLATALHESQLVGVSDEQIDQWQSGQGSIIDRSSLLTTVALMRDRAALLAEQRLEQEREEARESARGDIADLQEALDGDDPKAITDALDAIGDMSDDPVYSEELIAELGAKGIQDIYLQVNLQIEDHGLFVDEVWPSLEGFNDAVALGMAQLTDQEFANGIEVFMEADYGPKMLALIAASDNADGRVNAVALASQAEIYNAALSTGMRPGLFPTVLGLAYDDDMLDQLDERSSGADLADVLEHASPEFVTDLMNRLHNVNTDGGTMNPEEYRHLADLFGETLVELKNRHLEALTSSDGARPDLLMRLLEFRYVNNGSEYFDQITPYLDDLVNDPEWALWYMNNARDGFVPASTFKDLIRDSDTDVEDLIARMTTYQIERGDNPEQVATNLGLLLRNEDLLGDSVKLDGVLKSLAESAVSATLGSNPLTGPAMGVFNALLGEIARLDAADKSLDSAMGKNAVQEIFAFTIYTQAHGASPAGFDEYIESQGLQDDERAINLYIQHLEEQGGPEWDEMQNLITLIDESRDEQ